MASKPLHIISFDNPYPPVYGGTIDVFYKIKALKNLGYDIIVHCFVKEKSAIAPELSAIAQVILYDYKFSVRAMMGSLPFSVSARYHRDLVPNIMKVKAPILFESLKTTFCIYDNRLKNYCKFLRLHNLEDNYFAGIAKSETSFLKKIFFAREAAKYRKYSVYEKFSTVFTISKSENEIVSKFVKTQFIPVFHGNVAIANLSEFGDYALYHGDLGTSDNAISAKFLIDVFKNLPDLKLKVASSAKFSQLVDSFIGPAKNIEFVAIADFEHLQTLLKNAQLTISWSFQKSGTKLKVVNSLFNSRHCIINSNIVDDVLVSDLCEIADDKLSLAQKVNQLMSKPFELSEARKNILENHLNDNINAKLIAQTIERLCNAQH